VLCYDIALVRALAALAYRVLQYLPIPKIKALPSYHKIASKPVDESRFFPVKFEYKRSTRILSVEMKYSMRDLICDILSLPCLKLRCGSAYIMKS